MPTRNLIRLLIVDDEKLFCESVREAFAGEGFDVVAAHSVSAARDLCLNRRFDVVILDHHLPDGNGLTLTDDILKMNDRTKIILVTAYPSFDNVLQALKTGVHDYLTKPIDLDELQIDIERAIRTSELEHVEQVHQYGTIRESNQAVFVGSGDSYRHIRTLTEKAAATRAPVLITGETGTGKNVVAKTIHFGGPWREKTFLAVNCSALPETLIEAELFGVEKGAYTGAASSRKGTFEIADGGTLFLDEIGEMPVALQSKLLGVLEDGKIKRLGGELVRFVNVRVLSATNVDPERAVEEGRFRRDLFYRLGVIRIHLPPLRERRWDIPLLCRFFLERLLPGRDAFVSDSELSKLADYDWPGNIRELKNIIERCVILQEGPTYFPSNLLTTGRADAVAQVPPAPFPDGDKPILTLEAVERAHVLSTLNGFSGNVTRTAAALGISLSTLKRKLKEYGLK